MADQNATNQNPGNTEDRDRQEKGQAVGAGATAGQPAQATQQHEGQGTSKPNETAGQGGGLQGSGQSQPNQGTTGQGGTGQQGSERSGNQVAGKESEGKGNY